MLLDRENATGLGVTVFETEENMRRADAALSAMRRQPGDAGRTWPSMRWAYTSGAISRRLEVHEYSRSLRSKRKPRIGRAGAIRAG